MENSETTETTPMPDEEIVARVRAWMVKEGLIGDEEPGDVVRRTLAARYPKDDIVLDGEIEMRRGTILSQRTPLGLPPFVEQAIAKSAEDRQSIFEDPNTEQ